MNRLVAGIIVVALAVLLLWLLLPEDRPVSVNGSQGMENGSLLIDESRAREIVGEEYPGPEFDMEFRENCTGNLSEACWEANIAGIGEIVIDSRTGEVIKTVLPCNYTYSIVTAGGEVYYYNMGCENPLPACDGDTEICRACIEKSGCLRKRTSKFITGVPEQVLTWHGYDIVGTGVEGSFNELSQKCTVSYNHSELYSGLLDITECEEKVLSFIDCIRGECARL